MLFCLLRSMTTTDQTVEHLPLSNCSTQMFLFLLHLELQHHVMTVTRSDRPVTLLHSYLMRNAAALSYSLDSIGSFFIIIFFFFEIVILGCHSIYFYWSLLLDFLF